MSGGAWPYRAFYWSLIVLLLWFLWNQMDRPDEDEDEEGMRV